MSLLQKNSYGAGNTDLTNLFETVDMQRKGFIVEIDETNKQVEQGAVMDINGGLYYTDADTDITDNGTAWSSISNSTFFYVYAVGGGTDEFQYSTSAPSFDSSKGGWYNGNNLAVCKGYKDSSGNFAEHGIYGKDNDKDGVFLIPKILDIGDWDMDTDGTLDVTHSLDTLWLYIKSVTVAIRPDSGVTQTLAFFAGRVSQASAGYSLNIIDIDATDISLARETGGAFDNTSYNDTSYNRGWITLWVEL